MSPIIDFQVIPIPVLIATELVVEKIPLIVLCLRWTLIVNADHHHIAHALDHSRWYVADLPGFLPLCLFGFIITGLGEFPQSKTRALAFGWC